jgi:Tfp pilus assembly protein PilF
MNSHLKFVLVPWGTNLHGEEIWLLENALIIEIERFLERLEIAYADLYDQLGGDNKRKSVIPPFREDEILALAARTPDGTAALVDGLITVQKLESGVHVVEVAPRVLLLPSHEFRLPDAFRFQGLSATGDQNNWFSCADQDVWHAFTIAVTEAILESFDVQIPANFDPKTLKMTTSWPAYIAFIKGKRAARTAEEKLGYYRQAVRLDPTFFWARFNAGQLHKQQQDYHSARREFLAAIDGATGDSRLLGDTYFELGLCSIFLGDTKTARNFWDQALAFAPNNPSLLVNVAGTYEQEEDWLNAVRLHQAALDIAPQYYKALVSLARLKAQTGKIDEAIPLYEKALTMKPNDPLRYAILAGCYLSNGDEHRAKELFEKASELDPPGGSGKVRISEDESPPPPGDYARQELAKLNEAELKRQKESRGWRWFGR